MNYRIVFRFLGAWIGIVWIFCPDVDFAIVQDPYVEWNDSDALLIDGVGGVTDRD